MKTELRPTPETEAAMLMLDCDDSCVEIYTRNQDGSLYSGNVCRSDKMAEMERERDSAKTLNRSLLDQLEAKDAQIEAMRKERDELRDEIMAANSSSEMELIQETQSQNIQLLEQVSRLLHEKATMRDAIKEAEALLVAVDNGAQQDVGGVNWYDARNAALAKLKPLLP